MRTLTTLSRGHLHWVPLAAVAVIVLVLPVRGMLSMSNVALRDELDAFSRVMTSPLMLVLPVATALLCCTPVLAEVSHRFAHQIALRSGRHRYIGIRMLLGGAIGFATMFCVTAVCGVVAFAWVPDATDAIMPEMYHMTPAEAARDAPNRVTFSQLLVHGTVSYVLAYAAWLGFGSGLLGMLGIWALLRIEHRFAALALPFALYAGQTVVAALLGQPLLGLTHALFPFGIEQASLSVVAVPVGGLALAVALCLLDLSVNARRLATLQ
jgi:hypothetical protein